MNKISHLIVVILAIALAFAACGGNIKSKKDTKTPTVNDADDPLVIFDEGDSENTDLGDGEDGEDGPKKEAGPPAFFPSRIDDVHVECGKPFNKMITTRGGSDKISWTVEGLPEWATYTPSGDDLSISGGMPFEGCDVDTYDVSLKACNSKDACSKNSFKINTQIHGIEITTPLNDTTAVMDTDTTIPTLAAKGGSKYYLFTTTIPKELIGEDKDTITTERDIKFTPRKVGNYTITVKAKDRVFDGRENEIADKMDISPDQVGTATKEFKVNVKEDGFIIKASLIDAAGTEKDKADSVAKQLDEKSFEVPYDGKMKIDITGKGEKYFLTIKSNELSVIDKKNIEVILGTPHKILFSDTTILEKVKELTEPIKITITAKNEAGDGETLTMERITFAKDPCADESMGVELSPEYHADNSFLSIERGSDSVPVVSLSVKGGKGPFFWNIPTEMKEDLDEVQLGVTFAPLDSTDLTSTTPHVSLNDSWQNYDSENMPEKRETIKITRDTAYRNINASLGWNAKRELSEFVQGTSGETIKVYEILKVKVVDKECKKTITRNIPIVVEIPTPSQEEIKNVRFAHHVGITDTYITDGQSRAKMTLYDTGNNQIAKTSDKDIAARCGETEWINRWNWPSFDEQINYPNKNLDEISHLELQLKQPGDASWDLDYDLHRFYIVGKNWVYFDDKGYTFDVGDGNTDIVCIAIGDNKCPERPKSDTLKDSFDHNTEGTTSNGKWYLRSDPSSELDTWIDNETIKKGADTDTNACAS